jgi:hypothetical protein
MIQFLQVLGFARNLATFGLSVIDWIQKDRPKVTLTCVPQGQVFSPRISIKNIANHDLLVRWIKVSKPIFYVAPSDTVGGILRSQFYDLPKFTLKPGEAKEFPIISRIKDGIPLDLPPQSVRFSIIWRRGDMTEIPQIPAYVFTSTRAVRELARLD